MLRRLTKWAVAFAQTLFAAKLHATQGIALTPQGVQYTAPNPAAMWPPHRMHPTRSRKAEGFVPERKRMTVIHGRIAYEPPVLKFAGAKGLR
jgi:hypothetical protein